MYVQAHAQFLVFDSPLKGLMYELVVYLRKVGHTGLFFAIAGTLVAYSWLVSV